MDYINRLAISYYNTIATIDDDHKVYLVQHRESKKIYIKKILDIYNINIYEYLQNHCITGIPKIYDACEENGQLTIIEEFISGTSLQEIINSKEISIDLIIQFMCELCDILEQLHSVNPPIIHRDIKPSNIIITPYNHLVLIDFNAAKYLSAQSETDTVLLGTKGYAAPEQYGFGASTPQTDIYALGILLKELSSALPVSTNIFESIISKCTQINPNDRFVNIHKLKIQFQNLNQHGAAFPSNICCKIKWKDLILPGFRTKTPWKMLTASVIYPFIFWLCTTLEVEDTTTLQLWIARVMLFLIFISVILCCSNYCDIQSYIPLCTSNNRIIRYIGILILNMGIILWLSFLLILFVATF